MMRNSWGLIITLLAMLAAMPAFSQMPSKLSLKGRVKDAVTKQDLIGAKILLYDANGNVTDTIRANSYYIVNGEKTETSMFWIYVSKKRFNIHI